MEDKLNSLEKLKAALSNAEKVNISSVKIGDIIYVPLDEEDGVVLKDGYNTRKNILSLSDSLRKEWPSVHY